MKRLSKAYDEKLVAGLEKKDYTLPQSEGSGSFEELSPSLDEEENFA